MDGFLQQKFAGTFASTSIAPDESREFNGFCSIS